MFLHSVVFGALIVHNTVFLRQFSTFQLYANQLKT